MKSANITYSRNHLSELIGLVREGHSVTILDRDRPVARLVPIPLEELGEHAWLEEMSRQGLLRRGRKPAKGEWPGPPPVKPKAGADVVAAVLAEREESW